LSKREKKEEEEFLKRKKEEEEEEGNITIALFNPDRGTNKHVLPSFKKCLSFSFSALCGKRQREEKKKPKRKEELS
jgi:hypothetical protein